MGVGVFIFCVQFVFYMSFTLCFAFFYPVFLIRSMLADWFIFFVVKNLSMYSELIFGLDVRNKVLCEKAGRLRHNLFFMFYSEHFFVLSIFAFHSEHIGCFFVLWTIPSCLLSKKSFNVLWRIGCKKWSIWWYGRGNECFRTLCVSSLLYYIFSIFSVFFYLFLRLSLTSEHLGAIFLYFAVLLWFFDGIF